MTVWTWIFIRLSRTKYKRFQIIGRGQIRVLKILFIYSQSTRMYESVKPYETSPEAARQHRHFPRFEEKIW